MWRRQTKNHESRVERKIGKKKLFSENIFHLPWFNNNQIVGHITVIANLFAY